MPGYQEKITRHTKQQKMQFEQASKPDMAGTLELSDQEFKTKVDMSWWWSQLDDQVITQFCLLLYVWKLT